MLSILIGLLSITNGLESNHFTSFSNQDQRFIIYFSVLSSEAEILKAISYISSEDIHIVIKEIQKSPDSKIESIKFKLTLYCDSKKYEKENQVSLLEHPLGLILVGDKCQHGMMNRELDGMIVEDIFFKSGKPESIYYTWEGGLEALRKHFAK